MEQEDKVLYVGHADSVAEFFRAMAQRYGTIGEYAEAAPTWYELYYDQNQKEVN